jgi:hypothetical protein
MTVAAFPALVRGTIDPLLRVFSGPCSIHRMKVRLLVQDPSAVEIEYAIDAVAAAARGAKHGQAIFAFATVEGVELLLNHPSIRALTRTGSFDLIVGLDAITNEQTLEYLRDTARRRRGLHPKVFWNSGTGLFHPKLCFFSTAKRDTWVVGSGNLTPRGLRDSTEVFTIVEGRSSEMVAFRETLEGFLAQHANDIREIDGAALARAAKNKPRQPVGDIEPTESKVRARKKIAPTGVPEPDRVLIAELPRGGDRWQQANFDRATVATFFGVQPTATSLRQDLFLTEVDSASTSVREEVRRVTFTKSRNLRVQLGARNGEDYPDNGRPIAAFREVKPRHFMYQLLLPGDRGFLGLKRLLDKNQIGDVRRHITTVRKVRSAWPGCPLLASE